MLSKTSESDDAVNFNILRNCTPNIEKQNLREKAHEPALFLCSVDESPLCYSRMHKATACYKITYRWLDLKVTVLSAFGIKISNCLVGENLIVKFLGFPRLGKNASLRIVQRNLLVISLRVLQGRRNRGGAGGTSKFPFCVEISMFKKNLLKNVHCTLEFEI
jgi:hypothetical protein